MNLVDAKRKEKEKAESLEQHNVLAGLLQNIIKPRPWRERSISD